MSDSPQPPKQPFKFSRRRFNRLITLTTVSILASEIAFPAIAYADDSASSKPVTYQERYHVFIGDRLAQQGGKQAVTLKSGTVKTISIPKRSKEDTQILLKNAALDGSDAGVILHTLYDPQIDLDEVVEQAIVSVPLLKATRDRCRDVYQQLKRGDLIRDPQALDVLDTIMSGSSKLKKAKNGEIVQKRYELASQNSRLVELQTYIEEAVDNSEISPEQKQQLKGIYQYVRSSEALPSLENFGDLTAIDAIVQGSSLPIPIRQRYAIASALTRAFTADESIQSLIRTKYPSSPKEKVNPYLETYHQIRLGKKIIHQSNVADLDKLISQLPPEVEAIYHLARDRFFEQDQQQVEKDLKDYLKASQQAAKVASGIVPTMTHIFAAGGVTAGTGTAISSLTGAAATNATLAALGGGSVATGGLGMLGGLAIATGGAALVGAAALVSISIIAGMSPTELQKLGVAATAGTFASVTIMGTAWAVVSTFVIAGDLAGAAAISATIATLGGVSVMTGGAALIAFGVGLGVWQFLKNDDAALAKTLRQVEPTLYMISEVEEVNFPIVPILKQYLHSFEKDSDKAHLTPKIPIDKLSNVLSDYASLDREEKVLAVIDKSFWNSGKAGITFTDCGIWWKHSSSPSFVEYSDPDYLFKIKELPVSASDMEEKKIYELALQLRKNSGQEMATL